MRFYILGAVAVFLVTLGVGLPFGGRDGATLASAGVTAPHPLLAQYCTTCHDDAETAGGLSLERFDVAHPGMDPEIGEAVVRKIRTGMMPPGGEPRPERAELDAFAAELATRLDAVAAAAPDPGAPRLHRLNRAEYANAVRDLLALEVDVATLLPPDDALDGFDNIADALGVSPSLIEGYLAAAMKISRQAVGDRTMIPVRADYRAPRRVSQERHIEGLPLGTRGGMLVEHYFPLDAEYEFRVAAGVGPGLPTRQEPPEPNVVVLLNGEPLEVESHERFRMRVPAGPATIGVALLDRERFQGVEFIYAPLRTFRSSSVRGLVIMGPYDAAGPGDTPSRQAIFTCTPGDEGVDDSVCARRILTRLATRAFRRPVDASDPKLDTLMGFYAQGAAQDGFEAGVQQALARLLVDPEFIFRFEAEPENLPPGAVYPVSDIELASRLSFFLWSSIPDDELVALAADERLRDPEVLDAQIRRMLADPRAQALVENFASQWFGLRELAVVEPETRAWDGDLRRGFERETELLFASIIDEDRSILDLLDADYTFVDERLAEHYGMEGVRGSHFRRVALPEDSPRRGILGQGSLLTVTSVANRTSPVVRGAWILENLLGAPVPTPPPGVETDLDSEPETRPATLRERLELHRANPACGACHSIMDPVGLSLENFDLIGGWRERDSGEPIDASGVLVDGTPLHGPSDLRAALLERSDAFVTLAAQKLMTYALGRTLEAADMPAVRQVARAAADDDYRFSALVAGVVASTPFQMRMKAPEHDVAALEITLGGGD